MADAPLQPAPPPDDAADTLLLDELRVVLNRQATRRAPERLPGDRLEGTCIGRYRIDKLLGEGGMAQVYLAFDEEMERKVAVKVLKLQYRSDESLGARFEREARSMARIHHENVVHIFDFPPFGDGSAIAMEYLPGGSLRRRLDKRIARGEPAGIDEVFRIARQTAAGLAAAHQLGIVHRDIKPSNLLLDGEGNVKIADFGTIVVLEQTTWLTGAGQHIGTPAYMSPEQCRAERVTAASDVYSFGVTLFELLTGRLPFVTEEASPLALMLKHVQEPAMDPRSIRPDIPDGLANMILLCLSKAPESRPADGAQLLEALRAGAQTAKTPLEPAGPDMEDLVNTSAVCRQLQHLPQRAIVCWACRCARRVQPLGPDPRAARALNMAEAAVTAIDENASSPSLVHALSRIRALRLASLETACAIEAGENIGVAAEVARAAAAAASCAAARCSRDAAADAAFAARCALTAVRLAGKSVKEFWTAARRDYLKLLAAHLGEAGTVGQPVPASLFQDTPPDV